MRFKDMNAKKIIILLTTGGGIVLLGYLIVSATADKSGYANPRNCAAQEMEQPPRPYPDDQVPENHPIGNPASVKDAQSREMVSEKWKDKERLLDDDKSRPASYQKSLDEPAPVNIKFGTAIRLRLENSKDAERLEYQNDRSYHKVLTIDGKPLNETQYVYAQRGEMMILGFPDRTEAGRVIRMKNKTEAETVAILPKFNYHESRRWYIEGWVWISDNELLGLSHEEDGRSEGIVKSHFYSYDMETKTLRTLIPPDEVDPYQSLDFHGINPETGTLKISDENGIFYYLRIPK